MSTNWRESFSLTKCILRRFSTLGVERNWVQDVAPHAARVPTPWCPQFFPSSLPNVSLASFVDPPSSPPEALPKWHGYIHDLLACSLILGLFPGSINMLMDPGTLKDLLTAKRFLDTSMSFRDAARTYADKLERMIFPKCISRRVLTLCVERNWVQDVAPHAAPSTYPLVAPCSSPLVSRR